jgi:hypothetical protein
LNDAARQDDAPGGGLLLLMNDAMRARRHPWAVVGLWAWHTGVALVAAWPAWSLAAAAWGNDPRGDAPLWEPGGRALLDTAWRDLHGLRAVLGAATLAVLIASVAGLVPMAGAMTATGYGTRDRTRIGVVRAFGAGLRSFPAMAVLLVVSAIVQALILGIGWGLSSLLEAWTGESLGEARSQQLGGVIVLLFLLLASAAGVVHDLARAAVVRFAVRGLRGALLGIRTFRMTPVSLWWSWAWRAGASTFPIVLAAAVAARVGGRGGTALFALAVLHQAVVGARVALRLSWLAKALRSVDGALRVKREPT